MKTNYYPKGGRCAACARQHDDYAALEAECAELYELLDRQSDLLRQTAIALRGPEPDLTRYSHADIPERVKLIVAERDALRQQLAERDAQIERLQMQLAACGVVALANTPGSAGEARQMHPDYMSASCSDVADAVDREIAMRQQRDNIAQILRDLVPGCKWRIMRPRIDAALAEIENADE